MLNELRWRRCQDSALVDLVDLMMDFKPVTEFKVEWRLKSAAIFYRIPVQPFLVFSSLSQSGNFGPAVLKKKNNNNKKDSFSKRRVKIAFCVAGVSCHGALLKWPPGMAWLIEFVSPRPLCILWVTQFQFICRATEKVALLGLCYSWDSHKSSLAVSSPALSALLSYIAVLSMLEALSSALAANYS